MKTTTAAAKAPAGMSSLLGLEVRDAARGSTDLSSVVVTLSGEEILALPDDRSRMRRVLMARLRVKLHQLSQMVGADLEIDELRGGALIAETRLGIESLIQAEERRLTERAQRRYAARLTAYEQAVRQGRRQCDAAADAVFGGAGRPTSAVPA